MEDMDVTSADLLKYAQDDSGAQASEPAQAQEQPSHDSAASQTEGSTPAASAQQQAPDGELTADDLKKAATENAPAEAQAKAVEALKAAYQPNFKFKVADKEHEIDEFLRGAIKDEASNKRLIELYEKAYGLDIVKPRLHQEREARRTIEAEHQGLTQELTQVMQLRETDPWEFFKVTGFDKQKIYQLVKEDLQYEELPQEHRQVLEARKAAERERAQMEQQYHQAVNYAQEQAVQARTVELDFMLAKPEVQSFSQRFDSQAGQPGAFEDAVLRFAREVAATQGTDLTAQQAVMGTMQHYGRFLGGASPTQQPSPAAPNATTGAPVQQQAQPVKAGTRPPVIPSVSGRSTSPTEREVTDVEDLQKIYNEKFGRK